MNRKRLLLLLGFGLLFAASLLWKSPEGRLENELVRTATALSYTRDESQASRSERFRSAVSRWLDESSQVQVAGAEAYSGPEPTLQALEALTARRPRSFFELERIEVSLSGDQATAVGLLNVSETQVGDLHRDQRRVDVTLRKGQHGWKLRSLVIGEADNTQPWERP